MLQLPLLQQWKQEKIFSMQLTCQPAPATDIIISACISPLNDVWSWKQSDGCGRLRALFVIGISLYHLQPQTWQPHHIANIDCDELSISYSPTIHLFTWHCFLPSLRGWRDGFFGIRKMIWGSFYTVTLSQCFKYLSEIVNQS